MNILVTNDDGIHGEGLKALVDQLDLVQQQRVYKF